MSKITQYAIGANCNAKYLDGLMSLGEKPTKPLAYKAIYDLFSAPRAFSSDRKAIQFMSPSCGYLLFHRGSEHAKYKYAEVFADAINELGLGKVFKQEEAANGLHGGKKGVLYVWIPNYEAINKFWHEYHSNKGALGETKKLVDEIRNKMDF